MNMLAILIGLLGGFCVGSLTGMASAPTAGAVIAALLSSVPFFTLRSSAGKESNKDDVKRIYILTLCFLIFLPLGLATGILVRTSNWLMGSPYSVEMADIIAAGFDKEEAKDILRKRLIDNSNLSSRPTPMFNAFVKPNDCRTTEPDYISRDSVDQIAAAYKLSGNEWDIAGKAAIEIKSTLDKSGNGELAARKMLEAIWAIRCQ